MQWRYGLLEYRWKGEVDVYEPIEIYFDLEGEELGARMWGAAGALGDTPTNLLEVLDRIKNDIALSSNNKPDVIRDGDYWWWADDPDNKHLYEGGE